MAEKTNESGTPDELAVVRRAQRGDADAFAEIVQQHTRLLYNVALRSSGSAADAEDIVQEAFLKAWRSLHAFRFECALTTWLCRIVMNCCVDHARAERRRPTVSMYMPEDTDGESRERDLADPDPVVMPEEEAVRQEEIAAVRRAIDALPEEQRLLVTLRDIVGLSYAEIAEITRLEMGTVKSRLNRARNWIGKYLTERNFLP